MPQAAPRPSRTRSRLEPVRVPVATYRLQFNRNFTFRDAAGLVEYLDALGVTDVYASPLLTARPGSLHGYDMTDPGRLNPEIGTEEDFRAFVSSLQRRNMGLLLDVVPNHMCIVHPSNAWWWDVLENGPSSPSSKFFDIEWRPPKEELADKVLLPILGEQYGRVLESGDISLRYVSGAFTVRVYDLQLPAAPRSWPHVLLPVLERLTALLGASHEHVLELESLLTAIDHLPPRHITKQEKVRERQREKEIIKRRLADLFERCTSAREILNDELRDLNGRPGDPRSFDRLEAFLSEQAYRLSFWRVAADEINYRRFFDIDELAAIRVEEPDVFEAVHRLVLRLVGEGSVTGLRVDHPDGLFEPARYFRHLQHACREARRAGPHDRRPFYIVAEKILTGDEELRRDWEIEGTTGYGFLNFLNGLFVDPAARRALERVYASFTGWNQPYRDLVYECKRLVLQVSLSSELNVLARKLDKISEQHRWSRDFTLENLRDALRELIACFPIYRTYVGSEDCAPSAEDERHIRAAVAAAKSRNPATSASVFDFLENLLLLQDPEGLNEEQRAERRLFVMRLQQFTAPVMAKGLEDTAFYRYYPLASVNEVGGNPRRFGVSPGFFHSKNRIRRSGWPHAMLATTTHDAKRSEDVRARINVLSEIPAAWGRILRRWRELNRRHKTAIADGLVPDANEEYLFYQTLLGVWPLGRVGETGHLRLVERLQSYMEKALREAKRHTSWVSPNVSYEEAVERFVAAVLSLDSDNRFLADFTGVAAGVARAGMWNSLSQVVLKVASPGVPDFYPGSELWDFRLVDPDNRGPVDFNLRREMLRRLDERLAAMEPAELVRSLAAAPENGAIKLYVTSRALRHRRAAPELFLRGSYLPLRPAGPQRRHLVAFARKHDRAVAIAVAGRFFYALGTRDALPIGDEVWRGSVVLLRPNVVCPSYQDVFTGRTLTPVAGDGGQPVLLAADVFAHLPVALLQGDMAG
jgi:(1->4)-alpha-D-glucan 1-alpha-D-glucosylmutase